VQNPGRIGPQQAAQWLVTPLFLVCTMHCQLVFVFNMPFAKIAPIYTFGQNYDIMMKWT
jgi:hypothetical protein